MNTENIENYNNENMENIMRRYERKRVNLLITEARQLGKSEEEIKELVRQFHECTSELIRQFDEQKEIMESARKNIDKKQNQNPYEMGGRHIHECTFELRPFDEQKEIMESARKNIDKEQNQKPYEMGRRHR